MSKTAVFLVALLVVPMAFATPGMAARKGGETVDLDIHLEGVATRTNGGPDDGFTATLNITGTATRWTPNGGGNGVQIRGDDVTAEVTIVRNSDNETVASYTANVRFHAQEASSLARGFPAGNFKFDLTLSGQRSKNVLTTGDETGRVLSMNAHGQTLGGEADEDTGMFAMEGMGRTTLKEAGSKSATHYNVIYSGEGSITPADE